MPANDNRLSDSQLLILHAAADHDNRSIFPFSPAFRAKGGAVTKALNNLVALRLLVRDNKLVAGEKYLTDNLGKKHTFRITAKGLKEIGMENKMSKAERKQKRQEPETEPPIQEETKEETKEESSETAPQETEGEAQEQKNSSTEEPTQEETTQEESTDVDHTIELPDDSPEKKQQRALLKVKQDFLENTTERLKELEGESKDIAEEIKEKRKTIRETERDIRSFIFNLTGKAPPMPRKAREKKAKTAKGEPKPKRERVELKPAQSTRGKIVIPTREDNPNREGSKRAGAYNILLAHPEGMTVEEYRKEGGRDIDLKFFQMKDFVRLAFPAESTETA